MNNGKILAVDPKKISGQDALKLAGAPFISFSVTAEGETTEENRNLSVAISQFPDPNLRKNRTQTSFPKVIASGYHKGSVMLVYDALKLSVNCMHKSRLGIE